MPFSVTTGASVSAESPHAPSALTDPGRGGIGRRICAELGRWIRLGAIRDLCNVGIFSWIPRIVGIFSCISCGRRLGGGGILAVEIPMGREAEALLSAASAMAAAFSLALASFMAAISLALALSPARCRTCWVMNRRRFEAVASSSASRTRFCISVVITRCPARFSRACSSTASFFSHARARHPAISL